MLAGAFGSGRSLQLLLGMVDQLTRDRLTDAQHLRGARNWTGAKTA
jgi:hypothetical protein